MAKKKEKEAPQIDPKVLMMMKMMNDKKLRVKEKQQRAFSAMTQMCIVRN